MNLTELEIRQRTWTELERAAHDRHHGWRTPVLATFGIDKLPNARTVVLRHVDAKQQSLQFFTDSRSSKMTELIHQSAAMLVFWCERLSWQLRVRVDIHVQTTGPQVDAVWARISQSAAAGDYLSTDAPGSPLAVEPCASGAATPAHHLALLVAQVQAIDWLELRQGGHRRATFGANTWEWRVP